MIAADDELVGNSIENVPLETVLSPPKSIEQTALFVVNPLTAVVL